MNKTVLFIPGYMEQRSSRDYDATLKAIAQNGYTVEFVPITWKYKTSKEWLEEFNDTYKKHSDSDTVLAGFSYGAVIALMAAAQRNPAELWLFSLSPYFTEDFPLKKSWTRRIGKRRTENFKQLSFNTLAEKIHCKTIAWVGEEEIQQYPSLGNRAEAVESTIPRSTLFRVNNVGHDVTDPYYIASITDVI